MICDSYLIILKVNLDSGEMSIIRMDVRERDENCGSSRDFRTWLAEMVQCHMVYEEDIELLLKKADPDVLKKQFAEDKLQTVRIAYRHRVMDSYHNVMLEVVPDKEYSENQPIVYLYVKDIG